MPDSARFTRTPLALATCLASATLACGGVAAGSTQTGGTDETQSADADSDADASDDGDDDFVCTPDLETLRAEIFTPSCSLPGCHASADAAGGLDLEIADLEAELIGAPSGTCDGWIRVIPGAPDESLLYTKLAGPAPCGTLMPPTTELPPEQVACVRTWIENLEGMDCETCGGDACVDLESDPQNCGGCGTSCSPNQVCSMGLCTDTCGALIDCGGACVDTQTNPDHCGGCDNACANGSACVMGGCDCPGDGVSFAAEVEPVLVDACAGMGCHGFPASAAGLDLRLGNAHGNLVGIPSSQCNDRLLVASGQPGASYLMDKLQGINLCFGTKMPKGAPSLSAAQIAAISEWICRGAADN
jgi:hypothetical protein